MERRKLFLYGLGAGLITASIVIQLATIGQASKVQPPVNDVEKEASLTFEQLRTAAENHGYVLHDASVNWYSEQELQTKIDEAGLQFQDTGNSGAPSAAKIYAFTITSGTDLPTIARMLYDLGLVEDPNLLIHTLEERGLTGKVQAKYYRFDRVPELDELIDELVT